MKLKHDKPLSNVAFNCNLRHYIKGGETLSGDELDELAGGGRAPYHSLVIRPHFSAQLEHLYELSRGGPITEVAAGGTHRELNLSLT